MKIKIGILIFAGTFEGRRLAEVCANDKNIIDKAIVHLCVATEYGEELIANNENVIIHRGRLDVLSIKELIVNANISLVIDATHPYAVVVTENILVAVKELKIKHIRLVRDEKNIDNDIAIYFDNINKSVEFLNKYGGNILITTGSKELDSYSKIIDKKRLYVRVLPTHEALYACEKLGVASKNIICMQGPFSCELNIEMLKQYNCKYLITKNTGEAGGLNEKILASKKADAQAIVINRPTVETGYSLEDVIDILKNI